MDINLAPGLQFQCRSSYDFFLCFLRLPLEIRQEIWHHVLANKEASVITLTQADTFHPEDEGSRCFLVTTHLVRASYQICPLAHVCNESRAICLSRYRPCFEGPLRNPILFDPKTDLLLMSDLRALSSFLGLPWDSFSRGQTDCADMVRYLAICGDWHRFTDLLMPRLHHFHNLEHVILEKPSDDFVARGGLRRISQAGSPDAFLNPRVMFEEDPPHSVRLEGSIIFNLQDYSLALARKKSKEFKVPRVEVLPRPVFDGTGTEN